MECHRTLDATECKHAIRNLNGSDNPHLNALIIVTHLASLKRLIETKKPPFRVTPFRIQNLLLRCFHLDNKLSTCIEQNS